MPTSETALLECKQALLDGIVERKPDSNGEDIKLFRERFLEDFELQLDSSTEGANKWKNDRTRITALARAIGSLAEFFAVVAPGHRPVNKRDLDEAFEIIAPHCKREATRWRIRAEYCKIAQEEEAKKRAGRARGRQR